MQILFFTIEEFFFILNLKFETYFIKRYLDQHTK